MRPFGTVPRVGLVAFVMSCAACGPGTDPRAEPVEVGQEYGYSLVTHCGIEWAQIGGALWRTEPLDDGNGNPPSGWNNPRQGGRLHIESGDTAVFTGGPEPLTFTRTDASLDELPDFVRFCD